MNNNGIEERLERLEKLIIISGKEVLNVSECAILMGKSESRIRHLVSDRIIPYYKCGGRTLFKKSELTDIMLQERIPSMDEVKSTAATIIATKHQ